MLERRDRERANTGARRRVGVWRDVRQLLALGIVAVMVAGSLLVTVEAAGDLDTTFTAQTAGKTQTSLPELGEARITLG